MKKHKKLYKRKEKILLSKQENIIKKALILNDKKNMEYLLEQEELHEEHTFSLEFEQKMEKLFSANKE